MGERADGLQRRRLVHPTRLEGTGPKLTHPLSDLALSQRLERCEGKANAALVETRARIAPDLGATSLERAGAYAFFDGVGSPLTQTFCLGIFATPTSEDLDAIEAFFDERGAAPFHEVSPLAGMETIDVLVVRNYRPVELTSVMCRVIAPSGSSSLPTRIAEPHETELWGEVAAEGWGDFAGFMRDLARVVASTRGTTPFFAERDGKPIATGAVAIHDGVALLAGASTIPSARNLGAQRALLEARLRYAAGQGCDLAMMCATPGSASQRNAERQGFRIAYTRIKWGRR